MEIIRNWTSFYVADEIFIKYEELVELVLASRVIENDEERQRWLDSLENYTEEEINKFYGMLIDEVKQREIDAVEKTCDNIWRKKMKNMFWAKF